MILSPEDLECLRRKRLCICGRAAVPYFSREVGGYYCPECGKEWDETNKDNAKDPAVKAGE